MNESKKRYWELDFIRGICVLLMVFDHFMYSIGFLLPSIWEFFQCQFWVKFSDWAYYFYWGHPVRVALHYIVSTMFLLLCGVSCNLTHSNIVRGSKAMAVAVFISLVTFGMEKIFAFEGAFIAFGVIHMLAVAMLLYGLAEKGWLAMRRRSNGGNSRLIDAMEYIPCVIGIVVTVIYLLTCINIDTSSTNGVWIFPSINYPGADKGGLLNIFFSFADAEFPSSDYWPIIPYVFIVFIGTGIGKAIYSSGLRDRLPCGEPLLTRPVDFVGRHALIVYVAHQAVIVAFLAVCGFFASM